VLGSLAVLVGALAMGGLGFVIAAPAHVSAPRAARTATPSASPSGQLSTLSLVELRGHKPLGRP
jgi:hypothetical protein